jgi:type II secretory pathway pseudopilin PulG
MTYRARRNLRREGGFSYLIALFLVAMVSIISVRALENSLSAERREKEAELLRVGQAYRNAIKSYVEEAPGTDKPYPPDLKSLLLDKRGTVHLRPLRKLFRDPITGSGEWGLVMTTDGTGVMGVYSKSVLQPFKTDGFPLELAAFKNATQYQQWQFIYKQQP